jgi:putative restriction endonuclease
LAYRSIFIGHSPTARQLVLDLVGQPIADPQPGEPSPSTEHVAWHSTQVFRTPARVGS